MSAAIRVLAAAAFVLAILAGSEVLGQTGRRFYSVPGTGVPAIRQPYYGYSPYYGYERLTELTTVVQDISDKPRT
jgi:hypothetical protein